MLRQYNDVLHLIVECPNLGRIKVSIMKFIITLTFLFLIAININADVHELSQKGKLSKIVSTNDPFDIIFIQGTDSKIEVSKLFLYKTNTFSCPFECKGKIYGKLVDIDEAIRIFRFFSENTKVEFGLTGIKDTLTLEQFFIISTSYQKTSNYGNITAATKYIKLNSNYELLFCCHSHPNTGKRNRSIPSGFYENGKLYQLRGDSMYYYTMGIACDNKIPKYFYMYDCNSKKVFLFNDSHFKESKDNLTILLAKDIG